TACPRRAPRWCASRTACGTLPTPPRPRRGTCRSPSPNGRDPFPRTGCSWLSPGSDVGRRLVILLAGGRIVGRPLDDLLEQEVHEQEQGLRLEHQQDRLVLGVVVEVLVHAAVLDEHHVTGLPRNVAAVVHVVAAALEHVEAGAVEVAVLLAVGARRVDLDVGLDRLGDVGVLRADGVLAVLAGTALPRHVGRRVDPRRLEQLLVEVAVGAFERAHEGALLGPALPALMLLLLLAFARQVVADARILLVEARHSKRSVSRFQRSAFVISPPPGESNRAPQARRATEP